MKIDRIKSIVPAPMAAPETPELRRSRHWVMLQLLALACLGMTFDFWVRSLGIVAVALVVGLAVGAFVKIPIYLFAKNKADKAWLESLRDDA